VSRLALIVVSMLVGAVLAFGSAVIITEAFASSNANPVNQTPYVYGTR
jgi:hypothetical protein